MLIHKVKETIRKYGMIGKGENLLVGVSGGPDSLVLLDVLWSLRTELGISLRVAHLNHGLRGREAEEDADYVKGLAKRLNLPYTFGRKDVPSIMKNSRLSTEEAARKARYQFLKARALRYGCSKICLGHTADDQAETILISILRGSGLSGLGGIPPIREIEPEIKVIRPLIEVTRREVEEHLKRRKISPKLDTSNLSSQYLRNRIRMKLLPLLSREYNPSISSTLTGMARILRDDKDFLERAMEDILPEVLETSGSNEVKIDLKRFLKLHLALERRILRKAIKLIKGDLKGITFRHWEEVSSLISSRSGSRVDLPEGIVVERRYESLLIHRKSKGRALSFSHQLEVPGMASIPELNLTIKTSCIRREELPPMVWQEDKNKAYLDLSKVNLPLRIRSREPGDRFRPLGMKGEKKVKDLFIDEKVPRKERERIPLLIGGGRVLWVVGLRIDDTVKVTDETDEILLVELI